MTGRESLFSLHPLPWIWIESLGPGDPAYIRDADNKTLAMGLRDAAAAEITAWANSHEVCACGHPMTEHDQHGCIHADDCGRQGARVDV